jgi:hypothetical protein
VLIGTNWANQPENQTGLSTRVGKTAVSCSLLLLPQRLLWARDDLAKRGRRQELDGMAMRIAARERDTLPLPLHFFTVGSARDPGQHITAQHGPTELG